MGPKDLQKFTIEQTHRVAFCPSDSAEKTSCANVALKEKSEEWNNQVTQLIRVCKWTHKGLMPQRAPPGANRPKLLVGGSLPPDEAGAGEA